MRFNMNLGSLVVAACIAFMAWKMWDVSNLIHLKAGKCWAFGFRDQVVMSCVVDPEQLDRAAIDKARQSQGGGND